MFLKRESAASIHRNVYGRVALDLSTVRRWVSRINVNLSRKGETERPAATLNENKAKQVYNERKKITLKSFRCTMNAISWLPKVDSQNAIKWIPKMLTDSMKKHPQIFI